MFRRMAQVVAVVALLVCGVPAPALAEGPPSVARLAARLSPSVVNIATSRHLGGGGEPYPKAPVGSALGDLLDDLNPNQGQGPAAEREARSLGSGFLISADGLVVTNNHVIDGADDIQVFLTDGTRLTARLVGGDDKVDLAVLRVEAGRPLPFVEFGDSDKAEIGDWVMAIGNPFGLGGSVTLGIVSARNRDIQDGPYDDFIQTDASINQGNSGGPLFDMNGKVVGIATALIARGGSALGIGFAVPVNLARPVVEQLAQFGETRRGWLGVGIREVTPAIARSLGRPNNNGALVADVTGTGPADGVLQAGDLILKFDGHDIVRFKDLPRRVAATPVGRRATVRVLRAGREIDLAVTLGRLEIGEQIIAAHQPPALAPDSDADEPAGPAPGAREMLGLDIGPIDDAARQNYAIERDARGVVILDVAPGSDAERHGLRKGLVITEINQQKVATVADVNEKIGAAREAGRPAVLLRLLAPSRFVAVKFN